MIRYSLKCAHNHTFESWFQSADGFDALQSAGHVSCPICGDTQVKKALMAPKVTPARKAASIAPKLPAPPRPSVPDQPPALASEQSPQEAMFAKMRDHIEKNSDDVGTNFAKEARAMHDGDVPDRPIHGQASLAEAKSLVDDGVPVLPLPFTPKQKQN
ncbi:MAG: DUF1178 family protein [Pseudomonadota bacterium]